MNIYRQRDIVLVPFPFSDLSMSKARPVLILSHDDYNGSTEDVLVCGLTTNLQSAPYSIIVETTDVEESDSLKYKSKIKADTIVSLSQGLIIKSIARLKPEAFDRVISEISRLIQRV
ncbi:MAG: mRNA interferase MazF [Candidatus Latescibacterota bacterium]|jgi:mRNA interferase MazF